MVNAFGKVIVGIGAVSLAAGLGYVLYERNIEQPRYRRILKDGDFEVRQYPSLLVAEAVTTGSREQALNAGFRELAGYIFAKSRAGAKIPMTAPVIQEREKIPMTAPVIQDRADGGRWRTQFVMPARYTRATLPEPPPGVRIVEMPAREMAVVRFSGRADDASVGDHQSQLERWMKARKMPITGPPEYAFYNSPFIPAFLRRNEILIPTRHPS